MNPNTPPNGGTDFPIAGNSLPTRPPTAAPSPGIDRTASTTTTAEQPKPAVKDPPYASAPQANRGESAAPRPSENVPAERTRLPASAEAMGEARDAWMEGVRSTIRSNPLGCVAAALALGAVITRITR